MNRRTFIQVALPLGLAGIIVAEDAKKVDRLSGYVKGVDKGKMSIVMTTRAHPTNMRKIVCDSNTKIMVAGKAGTFDDVKENMRIVAIGKFEGVDLKATDVSVTPKPTH